MYSLEVILFVCTVLSGIAFLLTIIFTAKITEWQERRKQEKLRKKFKVLNDQEMDEVWFRM